MNLQTRIDIIVQLANTLNENNKSFQKVKQEAYLHNKWFIDQNVNKSIAGITNAFLNKTKLKDWASKYNIGDEVKSKEVGIIMAGNIPLVGFHDLLSVFISGNHAKIKISSKDKLLMEYVIEQMILINPYVKKYFSIVERITKMDGVIATGSNNSFRYFEYYFGKVPNIIRKNRNGTAVLTGEETKEQLKALSHDIFDFFGLGCRNISKIYVPKGYDFIQLIETLDEHQYLKEHNKYMNNYDYNLAIALLNKDKIFQGEVIFLKEDTSYFSRIANLHYEEYDNIEGLKTRIKNDNELIQVVATGSGNLLDFEREVTFGKTQEPAIDDYADGVDTMKFLVNL